MFLVILILTKGIEVFIGTFSYKEFIVQYIGVPIYLGLILGYKIVKKSQLVRAEAADLITDVPEETVAEEKAAVKAALREKEAAAVTRGTLSKVYRRGFSYLF